MVDSWYILRALIWQLHIHPMTFMTCTPLFIIPSTPFFAAFLSHFSAPQSFSLHHFLLLLPSLLSWVGIPGAVCKVACLRTATDPRYLSLSPLMGPENSPPRTPYVSPFLGSSLAWIGGSLFASLKVKIAH